MTSRIIGRGLWALAAALFFSLTAAAANGSLLPVDAIGLSQVQSLFPNLDGRDDITGQSQRVAVIDTGIQLNHPALGSSTVVAGINYAAGATYGSTTPSQYADQNGHATFVAGVIGSRDPSRLGVAPGVEFVSVRALASDGTGAFSDIAKSLEWVVTNATSLNITAVNLSMGSSTLYTSPAGVPTYSTYNRIAAAFSTLKNMNIVIAVASGNNGSSTSMSLPAIMDNIISVGATDTTDHIASYSNRNQYLELLAPGSSLNSLTLNSGYATGSGTSYAAPIVAGSAMLLRELYSQFTDNLAGKFSSYEERVLSLLQSTSDQIIDPATGRSYDRIDLLAAVNAVYAEFGQQTSVPEPASIALFALGSFMLIRRRKYHTELIQAGAER